MGHHGTAWLITGAGGMLGRDLTAALADQADATAIRRRVTAADRAGLDITDATAVDAAVRGHDIVVNTAAWTDVDGAEADEAGATAVNGEAVAYLARACARHGALLLQLSTDYVFAGDATAAYPEDAATDPINAYGRSKLAGELVTRSQLPDAGYVVRTAWLYGEHGPNFVATMLELAGRRDTLDVVDDQRGQPTFTGALAAQLVCLGDAALAGDAAPGIYHATASGTTTWFGLARAVFAATGLDPERVRPTTSAAYPRPAPRPAYSVLGHDAWAAAGLAPMPDWREQLRRALSLPGFRALSPSDAGPGTPLTSAAPLPSGTGTPPG